MPGGRKQRATPSPRAEPGWIVHLRVVLTLTDKRLWESDSGTAAPASPSAADKPCAAGRGLSGLPLPANYIADEVREGVSLQVQHPQSEGQPPLLQQKGSVIQDLLCLCWTHTDKRLGMTLFQLDSEIFRSSLAASRTAPDPEAHPKLTPEHP